MVFATAICNFITLFYTKSATTNCLMCFGIIYMTKNHFNTFCVCVVKLFDEAFSCFPLTGKNLIRLIFLFNCQDMKLNLFLKIGFENSFFSMHKRILLVHHVLKNKINLHEYSFVHTPSI